MSNELKKQDQLEKLARMKAANMTPGDIATATNLTEGRLSQIFNSEEFLTIAERVSNEQFEQQEMVNSGWDGIEALGITRVLEVLDNDPDPDFALKAAALANKAVRRGAHQNNPIVPANAGLKAVVVLNNTFIENLKGNAILGDKSDEVSLTKQKKAVNFMAPKCVQDLLTLPSQEAQDVINKIHKVVEDLPEFHTLDPLLAK